MQQQSRFMIRARQICLLLLLGALIAGATPARADERQYKVEAAFLYNFFNYITWPGYVSPQALRDPVICVYGDDPILPYLEYMRARMSRERRITVRVVTNRSEARNCNLLFMRHQLAIPGTLSADTLTVFKPDDPLDRGGMIELSQENDRILITINQSRLEHDGFQVSSRLLALAQQMR